jgi:dTMP kinase
VEEGFARKGVSTQDRFEKEDISFHQRVRDGYLRLAEAEAGRWLVIDATQSRKKIADIIWERVSRLLDDTGEIDD